MNIRIVFAVLFMLGWSYSAMAQTLTIGPRLGVNFGRQIVTGDDSDISEVWNDKVEAASGIQAGLVANFKLSEIISVQPELLYTLKGYKFQVDTETNTGKYDYFDLPVLAKISIGNGPVQGFVTAGPVFSYWMGGEDHTEDAGDEFSRAIDFEDDNDGVENRFEAGASLGVGLAYNTGAGALNLDLRYGTGFTSVYKFDDDSKLRNEGFSITLAYLFGL